MRACRIDMVMPVRPVRAKPSRAFETDAGRTGQRNTSIVAYFPTRKGGLRMERLRHYAHRSFAALLETDRQVLRWTTETDSVCLFDGQEFTPSFEVTRRDSQVAIRVVPKSQLDYRRRNERHGAVQEAYHRLGILFKVMTEESIRADPRLPIAEELLWHRPYEIPVSLVLQVGAMAAMPPPTLGHLHARLGGEAETWPLVLALVAQGYVELGYAETLGERTPVAACRIRGHE